MTINLFVGDNDIDLSTAATKFDKNAQLIDKKNYKWALNTNFLTDITFYTSLADLPKIDANNFILYDLILKSNVIFYAPPAKWSDHTDKFLWNRSCILVEYYLSIASKLGKKIVNFAVDDTKYNFYLKLAGHRQSDSPTLWIPGCSIPHGVGVRKNESYGSVLAEKLNMPVVFLTQRGSSIEWAADQILRSDIRKNDIVCWGLTQEMRAPAILKKKISSEIDLEIRTSEIRLYKAITSVHQVINFCNKIKANLILFPLISSEHLNYSLINQSSYYETGQLTRFFDLGSDNLHPGKIQHQRWADFCFNIIKNNTSQ